MTAVLIKRGDLDRGRHMQREGGVKAERERLEAKECLRLPATRREAAANRLCLTAVRRSLPRLHLMLGL